MTVITAVKKDGQVAIACDTQSLKGNWHIKQTADYAVNHNKLIHFGDNILGFSGNLAIHQIFEDLLHTAEPSTWSSRPEIFRWFLKHQEVLKTDYFLKTEVGNGKGQIAETNWSSTLIVNPSGIFYVNGYREVVEYSKFWAIGSGEAFALGALETLYKQKLSASEIAEAAALTATKFNPGCAAPIYVETVSAGQSKKKRRTTRKKQKVS